MEARVLKTEIDVTGALAILGLSREVLVDPMRGGEAARDGCTHNDAPTAPGYYAYNVTTRRLAERLIPLGWTREDVDHLALIVSPDRKTAIVVAAGDESTGTGMPVKTKYPKGPATLAAIHRNHQLEMFPEDYPPAEQPTWQTWMLLRHRTDDTLYSELSLPAGFDAQGRVVEWQAQIIIGAIQLEPRIDDGGDEDEPIDIDVPRR